MVLLTCLTIMLLRGPVGSWTARVKATGHNVGSLFRTIFQLRSPAHLITKVAVTRGFVISSANHNNSCPIGKRNNNKTYTGNIIFHILLYSYILITCSATAPGNQSIFAPTNLEPTVSRGIWNRRSADVFYPLEFHMCLPYFPINAKSLRRRTGSVGVLPCPGLTVNNRKSFYLFMVLCTIGL